MKKRTILKNSILINKSTRIFKIDISNKFKYNYLIVIEIKFSENIDFNNPNLTEKFLVFDDFNCY